MKSSDRRTGSRLVHAAVTMPVVAEGGTSGFLVPVRFQTEEIPTSGRMDAIAEQAELERPQALRELAAGENRGRWVWWLFPGLAHRAGDANAAGQRNVKGERLGPTGADLANAEEARAYIAHPKLRAGLLMAFKVGADAMAAKPSRKAGPWEVLDKGFGRAADGAWMAGPVNAYKCWCSATLFAAVGHTEGDEQPRYVLTPDGDAATLAVIGVDEEFKEICAAATAAAPEQKTGEKKKGSKAKKCVVQ